jgi:hypothetical protein
MAEKPNKKPKKLAGTVNVTALATRAGCSRTLILRLLRRGLSAEQVVLRAEERRARIAARSASNAKVNGLVNGHAAAMDFPVVPVPTMPTIPPFAESEKVKEFHLATIRGLQAAKLGGQVLPLEPWRSVVFTAAHFLCNRLRDLPDELRDELGPELTKLLRVRIHAVVDEARRVQAWEGARHGIPPPPPEPPEPVRARLSHYERYLVGSRTGEVETIPRAEQMESSTWMRQHPSISHSEWFELKRLKNEWDADMGALLLRRRQWDLPSELPDPPPEPEPEPEPDAA